MNLKLLLTFKNLFPSKRRTKIDTSHLLNNYSIDGEFCFLFDRYALDINWRHLENTRRSGSLYQEPEAQPAHDRYDDIMRLNLGKHGAIYISKRYGVINCSSFRD